MHLGAYVTTHLRCLGHSPPEGKLWYSEIKPK